jgi:lipopolysaccharide biosynthesis glycosyltransferase
VEAMSSKMKVNVHSHFSLEGCFRVLLFSNIFKNYDKMISLDSDLVVEKDIAELYQTNIEDKYMAASTDILMDYLIVTEQTSGGNTGDLPTPKYLADYLGIKKGEPYFNTGVAVFNIKKCIEDNKFKEIINLINERNYWFLEQDVLNIALGKNSILIDERWNALSGDEQKENIKAWVSVERYNEFVRNRAEHYIMHYAGGNKPWINPYGDFADVFFKYARLTPWYEIIIHRLCWRTSEYLYNINNSAVQIDSRSSARRIADRLFPKGTYRRKMLKKVLPKGSLRWKLLKKIFIIISSKKRR